MDSSENGTLLDDLLDALLSDLLVRRGAAHIPLSSLTARLHECNAQLSATSQEAALAAAQRASLQSSHCLPLLQRAAMEDPDDQSGLATAASDLINTLSGSGTHVFCFAPSPSVRLHLCYTPQATGTHGRIWRAAHIIVGACADGWAGISVKGARVLELGCGTGAAGLGCAALGAATVWLTDVDDGALELTRGNVARNQLEGTTEVRRLDVMATPADDAPRFGCVLVADCPFDFVAPEKLVEAIARHLATSEDARAIVVQDGDPHRSQTHQRGIADCIELAAKHPALRCIASEERAIDVDDASSRSDDMEQHVETTTAACNANQRKHVVYMHAYAPRSQCLADAGMAEGT